jgi:hypothetical protein
VCEEQGGSANSLLNRESAFIHCVLEAGGGKRGASGVGSLASASEPLLVNPLEGPAKDPINCIYIDIYFLTYAKEMHFVLFF